MWPISYLGHFMHVLIIDLWHLRIHLDHVFLVIWNVHKSI